MVVLSTQEQYVNYRAIMEHGIKEVYSIIPDITTDSEKLSNDNWNSALRETLKIVDDKIKLVDLHIENDKLVIYETEESKNFEFDKEPIIWNFTGGQKKTLLNCISYIIRNKELRKNDRILYIDGGANEADRNSYLRYYYPFDFKTVESEEDMPQNNNEVPLNIKIALKLKSYSAIASNKYVNELKPSSDYNRILKGNFFENNSLKGDFERLYKEIYEKKDIVLFERLISLNKLGNNEDIEGYNAINEYYINGKNKNICFWGYILEGLTLYKVTELLSLNNEENKIIDFCHDLSIKSDIIDKDSNRFTEDQLDLVILTKDGKLFNIEVKSGFMTRDNADSNANTTYKTSGVYGTTVLITPYSKSFYKNDYIENTEVSNYMIKMLKTIASGNKARMEVYYLDGDDDDKESLSHFINRIKRGKNVHKTNNNTRSKKKYKHKRNSI